MCGIAGIFNYKSGRLVADRAIETMCRVIAHRGPDASGTYVQDNLGLGHRRLSILDISERGRQPMANPEQTLLITYNGEVYNYLELREELEKKGYTFTNNTDTEVIIRMYEEYGEECVNYFNGMFAFAIWDSARKILFLARDRLGIKPLYFTLTDDGIIFSSEIKAILTVTPNKPGVNLNLLDAYMSVGYASTEGTLFQNIRKLPPGHCLTVSDSSFREKQYWDVQFHHEEDQGESYYIEKLTTLLRDSVRLMLRSDVPLGVFLSGGLDSSAVVALMRDLGIRDIKTFSVAFDFGPEYDERQYARQIADQFATDHHEFVVSPNDFRNFISEYIWYMDEPVTEAAAIALYYIAKLAREHVTVALSGEGSDEIFGGYPIYKFMQALERYRVLPSSLRRWVTDPCINLGGQKLKKYTRLSHLPLESRYMGVSFYDSVLKDALYSPDMRELALASAWEKKIQRYYDQVRDEEAQAKMMYLDMKTWLVDDLLIKADKMSMASSLELRVPFLDHRLTDLVTTIPLQYRLKGGNSKYLIKKAMEKYLPKNIIYRKKMGFPTPIALMLKGQLRNYTQEILDSERFHARGYFQPEAVRTLLKRYFSGTEELYRVVWQLLVLEEWHRRFID